MIDLSKKYEHRVEHLKEHKHDDEKKSHQKEIKPYSKNSNVSQLKKDEKKFHKKIDESEYTFF